MSGKPWTPAQRRVIETRGTELLVSASAGSGKTTVMIERIARLLGEGVGLDETAVVTFTKASAADMREKLTERLGELARDETSDAAVRERYRMQERLLPEAEISTVHSWCAHVIKTYFYASDADPDFEILDEFDAAALLDAAVEETIARAVEEGSPDFVRLYEILLRGRRHKRLADLIVRIYRFSEVQPDPDGWLTAHAEVAARHDEHLKFLEEHFSRRGTRLLRRIRETETELAAAGFEADRRAAAQLADYVAERTADPGETPRLIAAKQPQFVRLHEAFRALKKECKSFCAEREKNRGLPNAALTAPYVRVLSSLAAEARGRYAEAKRRRAYVDYGDLEHETLKILQSDALDNVRARYRYVFVDEYQDVNPLQEAILSALGGNAFRVGDVKQSVYGFRMCAPQYFVEKRRRCVEEGKGTAIELNANFRSDNRILQTVNAVFSRLMTPGFGSVDYAGTARFDETARTCFDPAVVVRLVEKPEREEEPEREARVYGVRDHENPAEESSAEAETDWIVRHIVALLDRSVTEDGVERPVRFSDIAVLVRSRDRYTQTLIRKLAAAEIPVCFTDTTDASDHRCVSLLISFLRLIDNQSDDLRLAAVLRSPFGGFDDEGLAAVRGCGDRSLLFYEAAEEAAKNPGALSEDYARKVRGFYLKLARYRALCGCVPVDALAGRIVAENDWFNVAAAWGGEEESAALSAYLDHLSACPYNASLRQYLKHLGDGDVRIKVPADERSVRVMTVHASKGLEFPFVVVANLNKPFNLRELSGELLLDAECGLTLKHWNWDDRSAGETAQFARVKLETRRRLLEEEMRVLYVAMTRAKYQLALFGTAEPGRENVPPEEGRSYLDWLAPVIGRFAERTDADSCALGPVPVRRKPVFGRADPALTALIRSRLDFRDPAAHAPVKTNVTRLAELADADAVVVYAGGGESDDRALERGNAYHKLMELIDFSVPFDSAWDRLCERVPGSAALADKERVRCAAAKVAPLLAGAEAFREQPFVLRTQGEPKECAPGEVLVQGVLDLLLIRGETAEIVDYKTTRPETLRSGAYRRQMDLYCEAVEKILKKRVTKRLLYSFAAGDFISI